VKLQVSGIVIEWPAECPNHCAVCTHPVGRHAGEHSRSLTIFDVRSGELLYQVERRRRVYLPNPHGVSAAGDHPANSVWTLEIRFATPAASNIHYVENLAYCLSGHHW